MEPELSINYASLPEGGAPEDEAAARSSQRSPIRGPIDAYLRFRRARIVTVEPVLFLYMFGLFVSLSATQEYVFNWYGRQMLRKHAGFTGSFNVCMSTDLLNEKVNETNGKKAGDIVQASAAWLSLGATLLGQLPSIFAALIYGPLTDRIGRKPVMLIMAAAGSVTAILITLTVHFNWPVYWFIPITLINSLAGGVPGILTVVFSYIADVSSTKWLTLRLGIAESMIFFGTTASLAIVGVWLEKTNCKFVELYVVYFIANILILLYVLLLLPESLTRSQRKEKQRMSGLRQVTRGLKFFFTKNEYSRWRLWFAIVSMFLTYMVYSGAAEISTLFLLHKPLSWNPGAIGIFQSMSQLALALSIFLVLPLFVYLRIPDPLILLVGVVWGTVCYFLTGFVRSGWEMYTIGILRGVAAIATPPIRSTISKAVSLEDQGAAFSVLATFEVLAGSAAAIVFYFFYPLTLTLGLPAGTSYFLMAFLNILQLPLAIVLLIYYKRPGAVYQVNKGISDRRREEEREREGGERQRVSESEEEEESEKTSLVHRRERRGTYGASRNQQKAFEAAN